MTDLCPDHGEPCGPTSHVKTVAVWFISERILRDAKGRNPCFHGYPIERSPGVVQRYTAMLPAESGAALGWAIFPNFPAALAARLIATGDEPSLTIIPTVVE